MTNKKINDDVGLSVWVFVEDSVWVSVEASVEDSVRYSVCTSVTTTVLSMSIGRSVINLVEDSVYNYFNKRTLIK
jgi:hypothetical protein